MKTAGKIVKIFMMLVFIIIASLLVISYFLRDQVGEIVLNTINKNIAAKIDVGSFRLSLLKRFPRASLQLYDVCVLSSPGFNKNEFEGLNSDTLLVTESMSVDFGFADIVRKVYNIDRISISKGQVTLLADSSGMINYRLTDEQFISDRNSSSLDLRRILLSDITFKYDNRAARFLIQGRINEGKLTSRISGDIISLGAEGDLLIDSVRLNSIRFSNPFNAGLDLKMESSEKEIRIERGNLAVEGFHFLVKGSITSEKFLSLNLSGDNIDLSKIRKYLPERYLKDIDGYDFTGNLSISGSAAGMVSRTSNPHVELSLNLNNGGVTYPATGMKLRDISFAASYSNGSKNSMETSLVSINNLRAGVGSAEYKGSLSVSNLIKPVSELEFSGRIYPGELKQYFSINAVTNSSGSFDLSMKLKTDYWPRDSITIKELVKLKPEAHLKFNNLNIGLKENKNEVNNVYGEIFIKEAVRASNLEFIYREQKIKITGDFINLPEWIAGYSVKMKADAEIHLDKMSPGRYGGTNSELSKKEVRKTYFKMPENLQLNIRLKIDSLIHETLPSEDLSINFNYKPGLLTFNSFNMNSFRGIISGNGYIAQNKNNSLLCKGIFKISDVNINDAFTSFRNFGQNFITSENLEGELTGSLTLLLPLDSMLVPQTKSMVAEGRYIINDGALINFEPVRELSSFIELSELENIRFKRLENDFFIRNNSLYIPQMEVNSSAADLSVNGKHNFDNSFEYHVKIRLSELLSKKRKKERRSNTEFGIVEDDGLGRTSILLRIDSKGDRIKVGYDVKAAGDKVKTSIKNERQSLKTILNQEYGLYKNESQPSESKSGNKARFRITWDESDTTTNSPVADTVKKENALKSLFRKR